jgi:hypothetical protein
MHGVIHVHGHILSTVLQQLDGLADVIDHYHGPIIFFQDFRFMARHNGWHVIEGEGFTNRQRRDA